MSDTEKRPDTEDFRALFLQGVTMIDTRAPVEFAKGAFPGAVNLPLMTDPERERVGTRYKQQGQDAAIELGHELVTGEIKAERVAAWVEFARQNPDGYLYCFRGGLRSQICQQWLAEAGCDYPRVRGGYKAMRRFLIENVEQVSRERKFLLLGGRTGAAKTELLNKLPNSVDLEGLAHHRGSSFGRRVGGQPTQIDFENSLSIDLLHRDQLPANQPLVLEDEGHFIGRCTLPLPLQEVMNRAQIVVVDVNLEERLEHSFKNYILDNLDDWRAQTDEETAFENFAQDLRDALDRVRRRLGGARHAELSAILERALVAHQGGDENLHRDWIRPLLSDYYDPMYDYQLQQKTARIVFRGSSAEVSEYLHNLG